ncbi:MAG: hypothetical protein ACREH4_07245 [Vitreimonas sp.]
MALCLAAAPAPSGAPRLLLYGGAAAAFYAVGALLFSVLDARASAAAILRAVALRLDPPTAAHAER